MARTLHRRRNETTALVLGAGASRGVSYRTSRPCASPLDCDFFQILGQQVDLLGQWRKPYGLTHDLRSTLNEVLACPDLRESLERAFYTLHVSTVMRDLLFEDCPVQFFLRRFARSISFLLRKAHDKEVCQHHTRLFRRLNSSDAIITFNYDLVIERALGALHGRNCEFGRWIYGGSSVAAPAGSAKVPRIYKLHGSSNWRVSRGQFSVRQKGWVDFEQFPGYLGHRAAKKHIAPEEQPEFPIMLPYWDKKIEADPWRSVWRAAAVPLLEARNIIIWGYSLPPTDIKAREFFEQTITNQTPRRLCVIDPSPDTKRRWGNLVQSGADWSYSCIEEFFAHPPPWW